MRNYSLYARLALIVASLGFMTACSASHATRVETQSVVVQSNEPPPGTVEYIWEEPMVDNVEVPPGLDPEGHYYRPAHQAIVEIRQGRWKYYKEK